MGSQSFMNITFFWLNLVKLKYYFLVTQVVITFIISIFIFLFLFFNAWFINLVISTFWNFFEFFFAYSFYIWNYFWVWFISAFFTTLLVSFFNTPCIFLLIYNKIISWIKWSSFFITKNTFISTLQVVYYNIFIVF